MENDGNFNNEKKNLLQKIYSFFDNILPFKNATECTYMRVKSHIGLMIGLMIGLFVIMELFAGYAFLAKAGLVPKIETKNLKAHNIYVLNFDEQITIDTYRRFKEKMDKVKKDKTIETIVIIFNSGGGSPAASDDIANYILELKKHKKVYSYVQSVCASGAYYIASATDKIYTNPTGIVGSIGVLLPHYTVEKLAKKIGVNEDYIAAGNHKVPMTMFKEMTNEDKEYLKNHLLLPTYKAFKDFVATNRNLSKKEIDKLADGIIYVGSMKEIQGKLVDEVTSLSKLEETLKNKIMKKYNTEEKNVVWVEVNLKDDKRKGILGLNVDLNNKLEMPIKNQLSF